MAVIPTFEIATAAQQMRPNLNEWRMTVAAFFDIEPLETQFNASLSSFSLGSMLIGESTASAQIFRRNEAVIQRSKIDHMMVQLYLSGQFTGMAEAVPISVGIGDICCFDLGLGFETHASDFANITMVIPKAALRPLTRSDYFHGLVLKSGETANMLLGAHMRELWRICPTLDDTEIDAVTAMTIELVRLCLRMPRRQRLAPEARPGSLMERITAFISENLQNPDLKAEMVCRHFAVSRATLYRQFEPLGGVASVIRNWRLSNVLGELGGQTAEPLHAIARRNGFANEASCARAFKVRYGLSPSAFRSIRSTSHSEHMEHSAEVSSDLMVWLRNLGHAPLSGPPSRLEL